MFLAAIGLIAASCGTSDAAPTESSPLASAEPVETTAATTTTTVAETTTTASTTAAESTTTSEPSLVTAPYWAIPAGMAVAVASFDGVHLLTGNDDRIINPGVFDEIAADPSGDGWYASAPSGIHHIADGGTDEMVVPADADTAVQLHDVGLVDGHATVFYNVNRPHTVDVDFDGFDEVFAKDLVTGKVTKIADAGGFEETVALAFGGGVLVGLYTSGALISPLSLDLSGKGDVVDMQAVGLQAGYDNDPTGPQALTISANGDRLSWVSPTMTEDGRYLLGYEVTIAPTDGSEPLFITLPAGPTFMNDLVDYGDFLLADTSFVVDLGATPATLIDPATRGSLVLPVAGPAAATGTWTEPPRWAIPSPVNEDVTEQIHALEPQWADGRDNRDYAKALADLLVAQDAENTDECSSVARTFPNTGLGDGPFYIELRQFCDDSITGAWYEVSIVGPQPDGSLTGGASRRTLCTRGVTDDGLCV